MGIEYRETVYRVGDDAGNFQDMRRAYAARDRLTLASILPEILRELPQVVSCA